MKITLSKINEQKAILNNHGLLNGAVFKDMTDLHIFMEHHVFAVWDFMSLLKSLQHHICPSTTCWYPTKRLRSGAARLINEIVLAEESDKDFDGTGSITHHDLYCQAMLEVGADARVIEQWVESVEENGVEFAMEACSIPDASLKFVRKTFDFINSGEPHIIAGAFCFGRETVIPSMFKKIADDLQIKKISCPKFFYYLERHIEIDGDDHGPASVELVEILCDHDPKKIYQAEQAALEAIRARIELWNSIENIILKRRSEYAHN